MLAYWSQPDLLTSLYLEILTCWGKRKMLTVLDKGLTYARIKAWRTWCRTVQLAAITIAYVTYSDPPPKGHKNTTSGCWWKMAQRIWSGFTVGCTDICEWLERNLPPPQIPRSQRRKVMTALRTHQSRSRTATIAMSVLAMQANATIANERRVTFDTDSEAVGVDNRCSGCISHVKSDFVGELRTCH